MLIHKLAKRLETYGSYFLIRKINFIAFSANPFVFSLGKGKMEKLILLTSSEIKRISNNKTGGIPVSIGVNGLSSLVREERGDGCYLNG